LQPAFLQAQVKANRAAGTLLGMPPLHESLHFHSTIKLHRQDLSFLCSFSLPITSLISWQLQAMFSAVLIYA